MDSSNAVLKMMLTPKAAIGVDPQGYSNHPADGCPSWAGDCQGSADLQCSSYNTTGQCADNYWWYSRSLNSAFSINHNDGQKSTGILSTILESGWSTGELLFENAAICNIQQMLSTAIPELHYTTVNGISGFTFQGNLPADLIGYTQSVNNTNFLPINGTGLSHLSTVSSYAKLLFHPSNILWNLGANGLDFSCTSQLDVRIANSWGPPWTKNTPSF